MKLASSLVAILLALATSDRALGGGPSDELLALAPADAAVVLVIDDFRGRSREVLASPLYARLAALPAVRDWAKSAKAAELKKARVDVEAGLGMSLERLIDDLLGDSVVLALSIPVGANADEPSGILMSRVRDRAALEKLIAAVNKSESDEGLLKSVEDLPRTGSLPAIRRRTFKPGTKPDEWYAILPGDVFVWSNSLRLVTGVVEGRPGGGFGATPRYRSIRDRLPSKSLARLYVDPHFLVEAASVGKAPADPQLAAVFGSLDFLAAALEWHDGPTIHVVETIRGDELPPTIRPVIRRRSPDPLDLRRVPESALAVAAWRWDLAASYDAILGFVPARDRPRLEATLAVAQGLLLGKDLRREILPAIGPGGLVLVEPQDGSALPTLVASFDLRDRKDAADAIANALRTVASLSALDAKHKEGAGRVETDDRDGLRVTRIAGEGARAAFAANPRRVAIGSDPAAVRRAMAEPIGEINAHTMNPIARLRDEYFPCSSAFVAIDLVALDRFATAHRDQLAEKEAESKKRPIAEVKRDFQKLLDLLGAFGGGFASWDVSDDGRSLHQVIGLVGRREPKPE